MANEGLYPFPGGDWHPGVGQWGVDPKLRPNDQWPKFDPWCQWPINVKWYCFHVISHDFLFACHFVKSAGPMDSFPTENSFTSYHITSQFDGIDVKTFSYT